MRVRHSLNSYIYTCDSWKSTNNNRTCMHGSNPIQLSIIIHIKGTVFVVELSRKKFLWSRHSYTQVSLHLSIHAYSQIIHIHYLYKNALYWQCISEGDGKAIKWLLLSHLVLGCHNRHHIAYCTTKYGSKRI